MIRLTPFLFIVWLYAGAEEHVEVKKIKIFMDDTLANVNGERIYDYDVKERMGELAIRLVEFKKQKTSEGKWDAATEAEWTQMYVEGYRSATRLIIRERLMIQQFDRAKMTLDEAKATARVTQALESLTNEKDKKFRSAQIEKRTRGQLKLEDFRRRLAEVGVSEDDWLRSEYPKASVLQLVGGSPRPFPIEFFFPNDPKSAEVFALLAKKNV